MLKDIHVFAARVKTVITARTIVATDVFFNTLTINFLKLKVLKPSSGDTVTVNGELIVTGAITSGVGSLSQSAISKLKQDITVFTSVETALVNWTSDATSLLQNSSVFNLNTGVFKAPKTGIFNVNLTVHWDNATTAGDRNIYLVNSSTFEKIMDVQEQPNADKLISSVQTLSGMVYLTKGDLVHTSVQQNSIYPVTVTQDTRLSVVAMT